MSVKRIYTTFRRFFGRSSRTGGNIRPEIDCDATNYDSLGQVDSTNLVERSDDTSSTSEIGVLIQSRLDQSIVRLGNYWSIVKEQVNNYCDDFKRKLLDNL